MKQCYLCGNTINLVEVKEQGYSPYLICQCCLEEQQDLEELEENVDMVLKMFFED